MAEKLKGKAAVVTGGGSGGIGGAIAIALAEEGAAVVVNDIARGSDGVNIADRVVEEIQKAGGKAIANYDSVASMQGGANIIRTATGNFGRMDILVNCAGNYKRTPLQDMTEKEWDSFINVHLKGHFSCTMAAIQEMVKQKSGRVINFSSRAATGGGGNMAYGTVKAGILGFTSALARELKGNGITVNCIVPSADTKLFPGPRPKGVSGSLPASLWIEPHYIAPIVTYLAMDQAQGITGRFIYASGGDLCFFTPPLELAGEPNKFIRKIGKWTVDELADILPQLLGLA
jgi:NAD(P)-dependent dehydrogenase (short-subunit alcohol dehydrogenase family)